MRTIEGKGGSMLSRLRMKQHILSLLVVVIIAAVSIGQVPESVKVTFYHTSDLHEHSKPLPRIASFVAQQKQKDANTLLLDSGDWCNKGDLTPLGTRGEAIVEMMAASGYDAVIPGNHDFSFGAERLGELVDRYSTPLLVANCKWAADTKPKQVASYRIIQLNGVTVGIIGTAPTFVGDEKGPNVTILPIVESVRPVVENLIDKTDILVLMTHVGPPSDEKFAAALPGIDLIFGGHHHKKFSSVNYDAVTDTVIHHSGASGAQIGKVTITWDGEKITARDASLITVDNTMPEDQTVKAIAEKYFSK